MPPKKEPTPYIDPELHKRILEDKARADAITARYLASKPEGDALLARIEAKNAQAKAKKFADTLAAASQGNTVAMHNIAAMYFNKEIIPSDEGVDPELQGLIWLARAAKLGHTKAQEFLEQQMEVDLATIAENTNIPPEALVAIQEFVDTITADGAINVAHHQDFYTPQELAAIVDHNAGVGAAPSLYAPAAVAPDHHAHAAASAAGPAPAVPDVHPGHHGVGVPAPAAPDFDPLGAHHFLPGAGHDAHGCG